MTEKFITHLNGIPKDKYTISDTGIITNKYTGKQIKYSKSINDVQFYAPINHFENRKRTMYNVSVSDIVYRYFGDSYGLDICDKHLWIRQRNGFNDDYSINNLELCLNKTNIHVLDVYKIYDYILKTGIHDNVEISKLLGYFVPNAIIIRLLYSGTVERGVSHSISKLFGYNLKDVRKSITQRAFVNDRNQLSETDVRLICKEIVENGPDIDYIFEELQDEIPNLVREKIFSIIHKKRFKEISDEYFKSPISLIRGENDPALKKYPDLPNEIWKKICGFPEYYVSNKGRVRNQYGRILAIITNRAPSMRVMIDGKAKSIARLVITTFGIDLPNLLGMDPSRFEVDHLDNDTTNNVPENLVWIPRGARLAKGGYTISDVNNILKILNETKDRAEIQERIKNEICNNSSIRMINNIIRGSSYSYFLQTRDNTEWRPIVMRASKTGTSYVSDFYEISDSGKVREIASKRYLTIYQEPLRELNLVDINGSPRRIDRMVYDTYVGFNPHNYLRNNKLIHVNKNTLDDTPTNLKYIPSRKYTDYQTKYEQIYHRYGTKEEWKKFALEDGTIINVSNFGRIRYNGHFIMTRLTDAKTVDNEKFAAFTICDNSKSCNKSYVLRNIVYRTFIGDIGNNQRVYEKDDDPMNCHVYNLELDYVKNDKRSSRYKNHGRRVAKIDDVSKTSTFYDNADTAAEDAGTSVSAMRQRIRNKTIINGVHWEYV